MSTMCLNPSHCWSTEHVAILSVSVHPWLPLTNDLRAAKTEWALDVLVHKWLISRLESMSEFVPYFLNFLFASIAEDVGFTVESSGARILSDTEYTGGAPSALSATAPGIVEVGTRTKSTPLAFDLGPLAGSNAAPEPSAAADAKVPASARVPASTGTTPSERAPAPSSSSASSSQQSPLASTPPGVIATPAALLRTLTETSAAAHTTDQPPRNSAASGSISGSVAPHGLISEVSSLPSFAAHNVEAQATGYKLTITFSDAALNTAGMRMSMVDLDVSSSGVHLSVAPEAFRAEYGDGTRDMRLPLDRDVDPDGVAAKFTRATGTLTITLPYAR